MSADKKTERDVARRAMLMHEMGLGPLWVRRGQRSLLAETEEADLPDAFQTSDNTLDITNVNDQVQEPLAIPETENIYSPETIAHMSWGELKSTVSDCTKCRLCNDRTLTVFGVGDEQAKWLFIGEGPGRNEDKTGEPFVGQAGKLFDNMLLSMGLKRGENAYIANIVKCRPTDANGKDRAPTPEEVAACIPYLQQQIALIRPSILVALGKTAAISLLQLHPDTPVSKLRGTVHRYADLPLVVTYHPAYLLRNLADKSKVWTDLCLAMQTYAS